MAHHFTGFPIRARAAPGCLPKTSFFVRHGGARNETVFVTTLVLKSSVLDRVNDVLTFRMLGVSVPRSDSGIAVQPRVYSRFLDAPAGTESIGWLGRRLQTTSNWPGVIHVIIEQGFRF